MNLAVSARLLKHASGSESPLDLWTRLIIPIGTFVLGALLPCLVQKHWRKRGVVEVSAKALAELAAEWASWLDEPQKAVKQSSDLHDAARLVDDYDYGERDYVACYRIPISIRSDDKELPPAFRKASLIGWIH